MTDREKFLQQARTYIGVMGNYVCNTKLHLGMVVDWFAYSISAIMDDCGFIGKYQGGIYGFASDAAREDNGKLGEWFRKGEKAPQPGDYIMFRYSDFTNVLDKYSASHVGIVESVDGDIITTLEGNVDGYSYAWAATSSFKRKTRYLSSPDVYAFYRPYWQDEDKSKSTSTGSKASDIDITYQVHTIDGSWLPEVTNLDDFAGLEGKAIDGVRAHVSKGHIRYRAKLAGSKKYLLKISSVHKELIIQAITDNDVESNKKLLKLNILDYLHKNAKDIYEKSIGTYWELPIGFVDKQNMLANRYINGDCIDASKICQKDGDYEYEFMDLLFPF